MGKATAKDVARAAGVSPSTVDRVLNNRGGVTETKELRVLEWARKLKLDRALDQRAARTLRIAVLVQPPDNPFHAAIGDGFAAANRAYPQYNIQFRIQHIAPDAPHETARRIAAFGADYDGIVIVSAHSDDIATALRAQAAGGKMVVALATDIKGVGAHTYIGPDNRKAGRIAADLMGRFLGRDGGDIVMIAGMLSMIGHEEREIGFRTVLLERYPQCRLVDVLESLEHGERAGTLVFDVLKSNPAVRGIYHASAGALPVVRAIEKLGKRDDIVFITHELTEDRRRLLRAGLIDAIIDQGPEQEVRAVVEIIASHFGRREGRPVSSMTPVHIHTIENC